MLALTFYERVKLRRGGDLDVRMDGWNFKELVLLELIQNIGLWRIFG